MTTVSSLSKDSVPDRAEMGMVYSPASTPLGGVTVTSMVWLPRAATVTAATWVLSPEGVKVTVQPVGALAEKLYVCSWALLFWMVVLKVKLLPEEPYGYEMKGEPNTLRLGDSTSVDYAFRNPVQENKNILFAWAYFEQVDITRVVLSCATENIVWQDCDSTASRSVKALDFDEGEALRDQATGNGSGNTGASSSGSSFSNQCISCSGTGRCSACGGSGRVYKILAGTTERVEQNCTSCNGTGRCWNCGGDGKK